MTPIEQGVYLARSFNSETNVPDGWALIPDDMELPQSFPRLGSLKAEMIDYVFEEEIEEEVEKTRIVTNLNDDGLPVETKEKYNVMEKKNKLVTHQKMTVVEMTEGEVPEDVGDNPTELEQMRADIEYIAVMVGVEL